MKIWIDILTPKQLLFSEPIIERLGKKHDLLCTSRNYQEVSRLSEIRGSDLVFVGRHGGGDKETKLRASIDRVKRLSRKIAGFSPDVAISFCSPEATRVSFGLGVRHVAISDSPHHDAIMRLTLPLVQKLLIPRAIPKKEFTKYGICKRDIIQYNAIDAAVTIKRKVDATAALPFRNNGKKNILIRAEEEEASYTSRSNKIIPIIKKVLNKYGDENIVILGRYARQTKNLQRAAGKKARVVRMAFDGKHLLENTDVFVGSGGTMTAESALMGVPTISYSAVPNIIEDFLARKHLVKIETSPEKIVDCIRKIFRAESNTSYKRASKIRGQMENPIDRLIKVIEGTHRVKK